MKEIGKSKGKGKRARMIEAYKNIIKNKKADGGRVGMFMGGSLPKGAGLLRQMIKMIAEQRGLEIAILESFKDSPNYEELLRRMTDIAEIR